MTTPPRGPNRPGEPNRPDPRFQRPRPPDAPTEAIRPQPRPGDAAPTERIRRPGDAAPTERLQADRLRNERLQTERLRPVRPPVRPAVPTSPPAPPPPAPVFAERAGEEPPPSRPRRRDPLSLFLIAVIVVAVVVGGLAGAELYARHRADDVLVAVTECIVRDGATVSFGVNPPFLWQYATSDYTNITATTEGNQVQDAKGMTAEVSVSDVKLEDSADSKGTIGALDATLTWTADGIKNTVAENLPVVGSLITSVTTDAAAGTMSMEAGSIDVTAKPVVTDGNLALQVVDVAGPLSKDTVQSAFDGLTEKLNSQYPLGIHADSVQVTGTGVVGRFSTRDASIPREDSNECFARL